jgi:CubicO group peptidase (beta-lactamase class C family)
MRDLDLLRLERRVGLLLAPLVDTPGAAIGVARDGALLLRRSAGLASLELGVSIGPSTTFRIASVSKHFTCAAVLLLAREGRLSVDDPLGRHLPELPPALASITLDQAMRNCSGARDVLELLRLGGADPGTPVTEAEFDAALARQAGLNFEPGTRFLYSNTGFRLAGQVVERVTGEKLASVLEKHIFEPLGMTRTRHTPDLATPAPGLATGYLPEGDGFRRALHAYPLGGEGGLVSGVEDLALWARALSLGSLGKGMRGALERTAPFANGRENHYALGLECEDWRGVRMASHGGLWPGYKTAFLRVPERRLTVIVIVNNGGLDPHHMALQVMEAALQGELAPPPPPVAAAPFLGRWLASSEGLSFDIALDAAGEPVARMHGTAFVLVPHGDGRLRARRNAFPFVAAPPVGGVMEVELDAGERCHFTRVDTVPLPAGLDGLWYCEELAAEWRIAGAEVMASGPIRRATGWSVEALSARHLRIHMPSPAWHSWADAVLEGETLRVNAARSRNLVFRRVQSTRL